MHYTQASLASVNENASAYFIRSDHGTCNMRDMAKITYIQPDGSSTTIEANPGASVMEAAVDNDIDGIVAECGGACSCATCHVYVAAEWINKLPDHDDQEDGMLDCAIDRQQNSRLSCQIEISDELDGLVVHVPEAQI